MVGAPKVLNSNDIDGVVEYMKSPECKKILVMAGAGISTSAGIPDFRSPGTGLYSNLKKLNLPYPEAVFEIGFFRRNPKPFYVLAHELAPGRFRPTITHSFIKLLADKGKLSMCFTQNIDTLERRAGVPPSKIVEAHGSFASQRCIDCRTPYPDEDIARHIAEKTIPCCNDPKCFGLVKPDIVFFGEALPPAFASSTRHAREADLLLVMGTSLTVYPFAGIAGMVDCPRVLLNLDPAGDIGNDPDDVLVLAKCDDAVRRIADGMGWLDELEAEWAKTEMKPVKETPAAEKEEEKDHDAALQKEVDKITTNVGQALGDEQKHVDDADAVAEQLAKLTTNEEDKDDVLVIPPPKTSPSPVTGPKADTNTQPN